MIKPSKYNGINFSYDFTRESERYNFDLQRKMGVLPITGFKYLSFYIDFEPTIDPVLNLIDGLTGEIVEVIAQSSTIDLTSAYIYFFEVTSLHLNSLTSSTARFSLKLTEGTIYSDIYKVVSATYFQENEICSIIASNNDNRHGYLTNQAFGFFKFSKLNSDIFINKKTEYEYSYGRRKILSSENNIGKRFTFLDLTMYQQNLLKWLCNTENLFINGVKYELISDFTELLSDGNSEIKDLRADFVEVEQSFFATGSQTAPTNVFTGEFFMK